MGTPGILWPAPSALGDWPYPCIPRVRRHCVPKEPSLLSGPANGLCSPHPCANLPIHPLPWGHQQQHLHQEGLGNAQPGACWWRMVAMVNKKGQLEPGMRNVSRAAWGARAGAGGLGRVGGDRGMAKGQAGGTQFPILPPTCILHLPTACSPSPRVQSGWHRAQGSQQPSLPSAGLQGPCPPCRSLPALGPVPCCDPALCCCLHGPQLSKPCCQTSVPCLFCWEQGWRGGLAQTGLQT